MFDFHRHFTDSETTSNAFYATSSISQWNREAKYKSLGLLADNILLDNKEFKKILFDKLRENSSLHIGEIGLDKRFNNMKEQIEIFDSAIKIAYELERILTIHIVNSNSILFDVLNNNKNNLPKHIIYHGFNKSVELATQLKTYNITVSINPTVIKTKLYNNIKELDKIGFLVETDWDEKNDLNYDNYFNSFIKEIEKKGATKFKETNNEFRSILENF